MPRKLPYRPVKEKKPLLKMIFEGIKTFIGYVFLMMNYFFVPFIIGTIICLLMWFGYTQYQDLVSDGVTESEYLPKVFLHKKNMGKSGALALMQWQDPLSVEPVDEEEMQKAAEVHEEKKKPEKQPKKVWVPSNEYSPDFRPLWFRKDEVSTSFIQAEARERMKQIESHVLKHKRSASAK